MQFGVPLYGGALTGEIVYMENNKLGCNVFEHPLVQTTLPVFLLVDRGGVHEAFKSCERLTCLLVLCDVFKMHIL